MSVLNSPMDDARAKAFIAAIFFAGALACACVFIALYDDQGWRDEAARAGVAEFYLDTQTGKVEWRQKRCDTGSGLLYFQSSPTIVNP